MHSALLLSALDGLARNWPGGELASIAIGAPARDVDDLLRADPSAIATLWASPEAERDGNRWSFIGWGEAARVDVSGANRIELMRERGAALLASVRDLGEAWMPSPRLFGGVSFQPALDRAAPWSAFSDASFALPRWVYGSSAEAGFLRLTVSRADLEDRAAISAELERIEAALGARQRRETEGTSSPTSAVLTDAGASTWDAIVRDALSRIASRELEKVVAARCSHVTASRTIDVAGALERIGRGYPDCVRFAFQRGASVFVGATPERLITRRSFRVEADALAGSARRDDEDDDRAARALLESDKDLREHAFVVMAITAALGPLCEELRVPAAPVMRTLRNVHHLWTPIAGVLREPVHALDLVRALHPTPAVCGLPRRAALAWIAEHEPAPRGWYAGAVGWFDVSGDGSFAVAIRSGVIEAREAWLYAGAGIVLGSDPARELAETTMKQAALLSALGVSP